MHRALRERSERALEPADAVLDLPDPYPDARIDIAFAPYGDFDRHRIVRGVGQADPCIERSAGRPTDIAGCCELGGERARHDARAHRAILKRGGVLVELDQLRELPSQPTGERKDPFHPGPLEIPAHST